MLLRPGVNTRVNFRGRSGFNYNGRGHDSLQQPTHMLALFYTFVGREERERSQPHFELFSDVTLLSINPPSLACSHYGPHLLLLPNKISFRRYRWEGSKLAFMGEPKCHSFHENPVR